MKKEMKNSITREACEHDLKTSIKTEIRGDLIIFVCVSVFCLPLAIACMFGFWNVVVREGGAWFFLYIVGLLLMLSPSLFLLTSVIKGIYEFSLVKQGRWSIEQDEVSYMVEGESTRGIGSHLANVIYFCRYGRYEETSSAIWGVTFSGDSFYLLVIHKKKEKKAAIQMAFPFKLYELKDWSFKKSKKESTTEVVLSFFCIKPCRHVVVRKISKFYYKNNFLITFKLKKQIIIK